MLIKVMTFFLFYYYYYFSPFSGGERVEPAAAARRPPVVASGGSGYRRGRWECRPAWMLGPPADRWPCSRFSRVPIAWGAFLAAHLTRRGVKRDVHEGRWGAMGRFNGGRPYVGEARGVVRVV